MQSQRVNQEGEGGGGRREQNDELAESSADAVRDSATKVSTAMLGCVT